MTMSTGGEGLRARYKEYPEAPKGDWTEPPDEEERCPECGSELRPSGDCVNYPYGCDYNAEPATPDVPPEERTQPTTHGDLDRDEESQAQLDTDVPPTDSGERAWICPVCQRNRPDATLCYGTDLRSHNPTKAEPFVPASQLAEARAELEDTKRARDNLEADAAAYWGRAKSAEHQVEQLRGEMERARNTIESLCTAIDLHDCQGDNLSARRRALRSAADDAREMWRGRAEEAEARLRRAEADR